MESLPCQNNNFKVLKKAKRINKTNPKKGILIKEKLSKSLNFKMPRKKLKPFKSFKKRKKNIN